MLLNIVMDHKWPHMPYIAVPTSGAESVELEVFNFTGHGGVALSMFNTDEVWIHKYLYLCFPDMTT